jgi:tetratricopeptide (TPR) repeat protein
MAKRASRTRTRRAPPLNAAERVSPPPEAQRTPWRGALAIFCLALALRLAHLWQLWPSPYWSLLLGDALAYDTWAQRLAQGAWMGSEPFYQAPLYPYALGVLYALVGRDLTVVRLAQAIVGSAACGLLCIAASRWFGRRAGIAGGTLLALYGPALFLGSLLQKSVLDVFILSVMLLLLSLAKDRPSLILTALLGSAVGCLALTRENGIIFLPVLLGWVFTRRQGGLAHATLLLLGAVVALAPAAIHNRMAGGTWILTTSQSGPNLYIGNSETATGTYVPLRPNRGNAMFEQQDATELATGALGRPLRPAEVSAYWRGRAFEWIRDHPHRWLRLTAFKLALLANRREAPDTEDVSTYAEWSWALRLSNAVFNFGLLAPLAVLGIWITRHQWRQLWVLHALGAVYALSVALFYVLDRYRFPLAPFLAIFAGAAITQAPAWWRSSHAAERVRALLTVATVAVVANWPIPLLSVDNARAVTHYNIGNALQDAGRLDEAIGEYRTAASLLPSRAQTHANLGAALAAKGEHDAALVEYREAVRLDPGLAKARNNLGIALATAGRFDEAMAEFQQALLLDPRSAEPHYNRGTALAAQGRSEAAIAEFEQALRLDPARADAHINMGVLLAQTGRLPAAIEQFRLALRLQPDSPTAKANLMRAEALAGDRR